jgi:hypothetical protein
MRFGGEIAIIAKENGLWVESSSTIDWNRPESWPEQTLKQSAGRRTAYEVSSLLEMGLADRDGSSVVIPYENFPTIETEEFLITTAFATPSPFLLKIDRLSDIGRSDFRYSYQFLLGAAPVPLRRFGFYVNREATKEVFRLDGRMFALVEAMDSFNSLPPEEKNPQRAWLDFASIKRWAKDVNATLDATLLKNDVIVPSSIGLDFYEDPDGALSFVPTCPELDDLSFRTVFGRNNAVEGFYSLDRPGMSKLRIVLTDKQKAVLGRMKKVHRVTGPVRDALKQHPAAIFDGISGDVELPYGDRVIGIGEYQFVPIPKANLDDGPMSGLWGGSTSHGSEESKQKGDEPVDDDKKPKQTLLIDTHDDYVRQGYINDAELAAQIPTTRPFKRPESLTGDIELKRHQMEGVRWLQTCAQIEGRSGVLLADDMGVGKTLQILSFLAWSIESGQFPDLSKPKPPFRPILIIAPLILLETETWENEMKKFFAEKGEVFGSVLPLYGPELKGYRRKDLRGPEDELAQPVLNLDRIQKHQVVITNYEAVRDYEFSFAFCPNGKSLWSIVITDEAHEYKTPNSKISHAIKALKPDFRIACTGTPVENRLLDMWNIFDATQPGLLGPAREFASRYEKQMEDGVREKAFSELKSRLLYQKPHAFLLRRSKAEVLELPVKHEHKVKCKMSNEEITLHQSLVLGLAGAKQAKGKLDLLHKFARMYQHPLLLDQSGDGVDVRELKRSSSKLRATLLELHRIRRSREKAIIFARHKDVQRMLARVLSEEFSKPIRVVNGDTPRAGSLRKAGVETRNSILTEFRRAPGFEILILSPFVAGVGLTIVEANHVIHYGRWWNPAIEAQATDRVYRLGQSKEVHVYLPILEDETGQVSPTFDQLLDALMEGKKGLAAGALQKDAFLEPQTDENQVGLQVFTKLEKSVQDHQNQR